MKHNIALIAFLLFTTALMAGCSSRRENWGGVTTVMKEHYARPNTQSVVEADSRLR